jgi:leucyl aminopeptidase
MSLCSDDVYPKRNGSSLKACWLGGKRNHFDGGLNIKTAGMVHMKCDMAGGAAVFGAMQLIADLQLPVKFRYSSMCRKCCRRKSIFKWWIHSYSGTSIEIIDTDAEGRLVLADGISYMIKITNQNILSISLHLPVVVLVHWVMNVARLPIMKPFLKKLQDGEIQ